MMNIVLLEKTVSWWQSILLGIVQGLGEFLPISSSGHLTLLENIFGIGEIPRLFDVFLHIGTLIAVFIVFWDELIDIIKHPKQKITYMIILASVFTAGIAVVIEFFGGELIGDDIMNSLLGFNFMITGVLLYLMELVPKKHCTKTVETMTNKDAIMIGAMQGVGTLSGISRSGSTIAMGVFTGMERKTLAHFSFLMSVPAVLGAFAWDTLKYIMKGDTGNVTISAFPIILGVIAAFVVGYIAINWMLKLIANKSFKPFAIYVFVLGILVNIDMFFTHIIF